jgi:hypothetical protein
MRPPRREYDSQVVATTTQTQLEKN